MEALDEKLSEWKLLDEKPYVNGSFSMKNLREWKLLDKILRE
jgi:hypothetical protein